MDAPNTIQLNQSIDDGFKLRHYWSVLLERRWLILSTFSILFALAVIYAFRATPIYQAFAVLQIDRENTGILNGSQVMVYDPREQDYLNTQFKNIVSRTLLQDVVFQLKLDKDRFFAGNSDIPAALFSMIEVAPIRMSRLVYLRAYHPDGQKAAKIVNTLAVRFLDNNIQQKRDRSLEVFNMLRTESEKLETDYINSRRSLQKYRETNQLPSLKEDQNMALQSFRHNQAAFDAADTAYSNARKTAEQAKRWVDDGKPKVDLPQMSLDKLVTELQGSLSIQETGLTGLLTKYKELHPQVKEARQRIANVRLNLDKQVNRVYENIFEDADKLEKQMLSAKEQFQKREIDMGRVNSLQVDYDALQSKADRAKLMYDTVLQRLKEYDFNSRDTVQNMKIIDPAIPQARFVRPNRPLVLLVGLIGGLAAAIALAFFVNYLDDSVKSQEDVENFLRLPFLGYISNIKSSSVVERDLQAHLFPASSAAEAFRTFRAAVSLSRNSDKLRVIAVTSTIPSEGKSLVASNFAIVTAQTGLRTVLIDSDLRRPSVHKAFQLQSPVGLSAYLGEEINDVSEIIHSTHVPNLDVVCCGATPSNPSELVGSRRMLQFLEEVAGRYDRVVVDCPPVSAVADPLIVGAMCDGMVYVTKFNTIRREHARRSVQRLQDAGIHLIGVIMNDIDFEGKDSYYYSNYYYQNQYYATHYRSDGSGSKVGRTPPAVEKQPVAKI
ncbi:MAG: polysaccharide biosynthesis tyrosine autokinase [Pedosphaera sp.]|nr:polysaccharide biosynthesis tyrosine autokinase [Pedosphaera sp.]